MFCVTFNERAQHLMGTDFSCESCVTSVTSVTFVCVTIPVFKEIQ